MRTEIPDPAEIFSQAVGISDAAERLAYLNQACAGHPTLRVEVEDLLRRDAEASQFLNSPIEFGNTLLGQQDLERVGTQIGAYKLLQVIGEGGMGTVYMAEQRTPVERRVALKVIKPGMDTRQVIARFEAERQALAMMDHPNIAKVLDAGTTSNGRPYFVMELVNGIPLTQFCDEQRLSTKERLELFLPICQAVQHAHQKGIIHRDIKPSNLLVALYDGRSVPKVIDFGVAKATGSRLTEKTMFTGLGQIVGTLEYMSPEQAQRNQLDIDTRSDVYSLGVVLYELLTGETPFDKKRLRSAAIDELLRIIREEEPPRPSTRLSSSGSLPSVAANRRIEPAKLSTLMRGELDWIVMKTLEKDRSRRYATANALAADVSHYLNDEPVVACPPSTAYRFRKFARRHRIAFATISVVAAALLMGIVGTTWQAIVAIQQRDRAVAAESLAQRRLVSESKALKAEAEQRREADSRRSEAITQRDRAVRAEESAEAQRLVAEANFQRARQAVDDMYTQVAEQWLAHQPNLQPLQREFLEKALKFYQESAGQRSDDAAIRFEAARSGRRVAEILHRLGKRDEAAAAGGPALEQMESLVAQYPSVPEYRVELAEDLQKSALNIEDTRGDASELPPRRRAVELLEQLVAEFPDVAEYRQRLASGYCLLSGSLKRAGQAIEGAAAIEKALRIQQQLVTEYPDNQNYRRQLAGSHATRATNFKGLGDVTEAIDEWKAATRLLEGVVAEHSHVSEVRNELASAYYWIGNAHSEPAAREEWFKKALEVQESLAADFPDFTDYRYDLLRTLGTFGWHLIEQGRAADAEVPLRRAVNVGAKLVADSPETHYYWTRLSSTKLGFGDCLQAMGKLTEAEETYRAALREHAEFVAKFPDFPEATARYWTCEWRLASILQNTSREAEAAAIWQRSVEEMPNDAAVLNGIAWAAVAAACSQAQAAMAAKFAQRAVELEPNGAHIWNTLGVARYRAGDWQAAINAFRKSIELTNGGLTTDWFFMAMANWQLGQRDDARVWFKAARLSTERFSPDDLEHHKYRNEAAALLGMLAQEPFDESDEMAAGDILIKTMANAAAYQHRGHALASNQKWSRAVDDFQSSIRLGESGIRVWYQLSLAQLAAGDRTGFNATCSSMIPKFAAAEDADIMYQAAWTCCLAPDALADFGSAIAIAERAQQLDDKLARYGAALGALQFRAGRFEHAKTTLEVARERMTPEEAEFFSPAYIAFFLAMVNQRLGQTDAARQRFNEGCEMAEPQLKAAKEDWVSIPWTRRLTLTLLRDEAARVIDANAIPSGAPD